MNRNVRLLILVSWLFGYASGAYEVLFPLYLDWVGVSFTDIGIIFGITAATIAGLNIVIGSQSDARGRKAFYSIGLALCTAINFIVPFFRKLWEMFVLSIAQSSASSIRGSVHNPVSGQQQVLRPLAKVSNWLTVYRKNWAKWSNSC